MNELIIIWLWVLSVLFVLQLTWMGFMSKALGEICKEMADILERRP